MDTSIEYINMCREAKELQESWDQEVGDFHKKPHDKYIYIVDKVTMKTEGCVWLPRLDQLVSLSGWNWHDFLFEVVEYHRGFDVSPEMNALDALMEINYRKEWNGKTWIPII